MIYLDYSATTPVNEDVLNSFIEVNKRFIGNGNSLHEEGVKIASLIDSATEQIANILNVKTNEIIYTSGASESNNMAIKGIAYRYKNYGKHIITSRFEHSSVIEPLKYLKEQGYEVDYVNYNELGVIDINHLKSLIREDTILVSISAVNSEIGIIQPIEEIGKIIKEYDHCYFHVDLTQAIGKIKFSLNNIDLASFSAHKFYGLKGIGCLIKKHNIDLIPLIHGGASTTIFRSGTPAHPLIVSISKALRIAHNNLDSKIEHVEYLNKLLKDNLSSYPKVTFNSNTSCIPHIFNISIEGIKAETFMHNLAKNGVIVSTKTACSHDDSLSESVYYLTKDEERAKSSIRISISHLTTEDEIKKFFIVFKKCYQELIN